MAVRPPIARAFCALSLVNGGLSTPVTAQDLACPCCVARSILSGGAGVPTGTHQDLTIVVKPALTGLVGAGVRVHGL